MRHLHTLFSISVGDNVTIGIGYTEDGPLFFVWKRDGEIEFDFKHGLRRYSQDVDGCFPWGEPLIPDDLEMALPF